MKYIIPLEKIESADRAKVGDKCYRLSHLARIGYSVPTTICLTIDAYENFIDQEGLRERIMMALHRKKFKDMRWEEIWDTSLRIRNMFLGTPLPESVKIELTIAVKDSFSDHPLVIRSSSPDEDSRQRSFAGLHESYVNVCGMENILDKIRMVWASLWSDAALLYRQELDLHVETSTMAVVLQNLVVGDTSGVFFSHHPTNKNHAVLEAVYGLNQGLVDGTIEPDRWVLSREAGRVISHTPANRQNRLVLSKTGTVPQPLPPKKSQTPPLTSIQIQSILDTGMAVVNEMHQPQDIEWTISDGKLMLLQARPITAQPSEDSNDKRSWYLSLHRSFENLKELRDRIVNKLIPEMKRVATDLTTMELVSLNHSQLLAEIEKRKAINDHWVKIYWKDFIPFAHGIRLFGQYYNDTVRPEDPYEFMTLLEHTDLKSVARNKQLESLADIIRLDRMLAEKLKAGIPADNEEFYRQLQDFIEQFGDLSCSVTGGVECTTGEQGIILILLEMASYPPRIKREYYHHDLDALSRNFLSHVDKDKREEAREILALGRTSYQLRDDDNIYLGRIESCVLDAIQEAKERLGDSRLRIDADTLRKLKMHVDTLASPGNGTVPRKMIRSRREQPLKARQVVGQPAGPGIARGKAYVISRHSDLFDFKHGNILVCEAVDPNMTFVIPIAKAVVEKRGGMLIHGAIIAREYGLPCVTGVPDANRIIRTGDDIVVDGYLGIVTIED